MALYFDAVLGNDANSGLSWGAAKKTWGAVSGMSIAAGTTCILRKGQTFVMPGPVISVDPGDPGGSARANPTLNPIIITSQARQGGDTGSPVINNARVSVLGDWVQGSFYGNKTAPTWQSGTSYSAGTVIKTTFVDRWSEKQVTYGILGSTFNVTMNFVAKDTHTSTGDFMADLDNGHWDPVFTEGTTDDHKMWFTPYRMTGYFGSAMWRRAWPDGPSNSKTSGLVENYVWAYGKKLNANGSLTNGSIVYAVDASGKPSPPTSVYKDWVTGEHDLRLIPWTNNDLWDALSNYGAAIWFKRPYCGVQISDIDFSHCGPAIQLAPTTPRNGVIYWDSLKHGAQISNIRVMECYSGIGFQGNSTSCDPLVKTEWRQVQVSNIRGRNIGSFVVEFGTHKYNAGVLGASYAKDLVGYKVGACEGKGVFYGSPTAFDGSEVLVEYVSGYLAKHGAYWTADGCVVYADHDAANVRFRYFWGWDCDTVVQNNYANGTVTYEKGYARARSDGSSGFHGVRLDYGYTTNFSHAHNVIVQDVFCHNFRDPLSIRDIGTHTHQAEPTKHKYTVSNCVFYRGGTATRKAIQRARKTPYTTTVIQNNKFWGYTAIAALVDADWEGNWFNTAGTTITNGAYNTSLSGNTNTDLSSALASMPQLAVNHEANWERNYAKELPTTGWGTWTFSGTTVNPPVLNSISPSQVDEGSATFNLTLNCSNLSATDTVRVDGVTRAKVSQTTNTIVISIDASEITYQKTILIEVVNALGQASAAKILTVLDVAQNPPAPILTSLSPSSVTAGDTDTVVRITGQNFTNTDVGQVNAVDRTTSYVSATAIDVTVTTADMADAGILEVGARTALSEIAVPLLLPVVAATDAPTITSLSSVGKKVGDTTFTLTVKAEPYGGLKNTDVVQVNGQDRTTTYVSATKLRVDILTADMVAAGNITITVKNASNNVSNPLLLPVVSDATTDTTVLVGRIARTTPFGC